MKIVRSLIMLTFCLMAMCAVAQEQPRANVIAYDDENDIEKLKYTDSPYYISLDGSWQRSTNDSALVFTRRIDVPKAWKGYHAYLNVRTDGACVVSVNGTESGRNGDSRNWGEFDITNLLKYGKSNTITVRVLNHSESDKLEVGMVRSGSGINGASFISLKPEVNVRDYVVSTSYQHRTSQASFTLQADIANPTKKGRYYLEVELWDPKGHRFDKMGKWAVFDKRNELRLKVEGEYAQVEPWSAEMPNLYTAVLRLRDENMNIIETVGTKFGFRSVEIDDGLLKVNGRPITLRGVVYSSPKTEGEYTYIRMRQDLLQMKRNNINAVRTSYYSPADPYFYELCDNLGLYVICDANIQPHSSKSHAVATDKEYSPQFVQRVQNMYGRYKNQTSIIAWSLGNSLDNGVCMEDAYKALKAYDKSRPVIFSGAQYSENTDIISPQNPTADEVRQYCAKQQTRPLVVLSCSDVADGVYANFDDIWQLVRKQASVQGCFINGWVPVNTYDEEKKAQNTRQGLLTASRHAKPAVASLKYLFRPYDITLVSLSADQGEFTVRNMLDFASLSDYSMEYIIRTNHKQRIVEGDLPLSLGPGESENFKLRLPQLTLYSDEELFIRFIVKQRRATPYAPAGTIVGETEFPLEMPRLARSPLSEFNRQPLQVVADSIITVAGEHFVLVFDSATCDITKYKYDDYSSENAVLFDLNTTQTRTKSPVEVSAAAYSIPAPYTLCIERLLRYWGASDVHQTIEVLHTGDIIITNEIPRIKANGKYLIGSINIPQAFDTVEWFGNSRDVCFANDPGRLIDINKTGLNHFSDTSDGGHRSEVRWLSLSNATEGIYIEMIDTLMEFEIDDGRLLFYVPLSDTGTSVYRCHFRRYNRYENAPYDFYRIEYPRMASNMPQMPVITSEKVRFDSPMKVFITSPESDVVLRYTTDGSEPTATSTLYTEPFTIETSTVVKSRAFKNGGAMSFTASRNFGYDYMQSVSYSRKPNTPYNKDAETILFDGELGTIDDLSRGWLGFSGTGVDIVFELSKQIDVDAVRMDFAHNPDVWVFAPIAVSVSTSSDGEHFSEPAQATITYNPADETMPSQTISLTIPIEAKDVKKIRISTATLQRIPEWHRGKGLKPWLLTDEIFVSEHIDNQE